MICGKCGSEIPDDSRFCLKCGTGISGAGISDAGVGSNNANSVVRQRHGFTSFWLIFCLVINIIATFVFIYTVESFREYTDMPDRIITFTIVLSVAGVSGFIMLLCWKRAGFWVYTVASIISVIISSSMMNASFTDSLLGLAGIAILWGVLNIRRNGRTTWEQLDKLDLFDK